MVAGIVLWVFVGSHSTLALCFLIWMCVGQPHVPFAYRSHSGIWEKKLPIISIPSVNFLCTHLFGWISVYIYRHFYWILYGKISLPDPNKSDCKSERNSPKIIRQQVVSKAGSGSGSGQIWVPKSEARFEIIVGCLAGLLIEYSVVNHNGLGLSTTCDINFVCFSKFLLWCVAYSVKQDLLRSFPNYSFNTNNFNNLTTLVVYIIIYVHSWQIMKIGNGKTSLSEWHLY